MVASGKLVVRAGRALTNAEINKYYAKSTVVWNAYKRSMQSGVLAKAYMFGTPVVVSILNKSEYFLDRENGVLVSGKYDFTEIQDAIGDIILRFEEYSSQCRRRFLDVFYYKAQSTAFMDFVSSD
jgi:glycosyltransferase involved in cell wall biosynthesis